MNGVPMLPPVGAFLPHSFRMLPIRVVQVVLPLVPVMAMMGAGANRAASSISLMISMPRVRAGARNSASASTPGLSTMHSASAGGVEVP